ncbi:uncharacterized protein KY384_008794 [Bacidia gigantensis]|uniref:uncharacterized protein n=1 Tax=Bacidia gigantensis TaxID=2732470 RepID=UPI001D0545C4|nr:uncharacterized protein KY384_008794 [Bacidia gigantensis]KAG8526593.1 hypothetical protein KY384_008794 [Bacidia gigantensis]
MYVFLIAAPLAGLSMILMPLLVILIQLIVTRGDGVAIRKSMGILLGRLPLDKSVEFCAKQKARAYAEDLRRRCSEEPKYDDYKAAIVASQGEYREATADFVENLPRGVDVETFTESPDVKRFQGAFEKMIFNKLMLTALDDSVSEATENEDNTVSSETQGDEPTTTTDLSPLIREKKAAPFTAPVPLNGLPEPVKTQARELREKRRELQKWIDAELARFPLNADEEAEALEDISPKPFALTSQLVRSVIIQLALLSQSATSIWLFFRRVSHGSDALYDHRLLQLSILGACVSLMNIVSIVIQPHYPLQDNNEDKRMDWVYYLRIGAIREQNIVEDIYKEVSEDPAKRGINNEIMQAIASILTEIIFELLGLYFITLAATKIGLRCGSPVDFLDGVGGVCLRLTSTIMESFWSFIPALMALARRVTPFRGEFWKTALRRYRWTFFLATLFCAFSATSVLLPSAYWAASWSQSLLDSVQQLIALFSIPPDSQDYRNAACILTKSLSDVASNASNVPFINNSLLKPSGNTTELDGGVTYLSCTLFPDWSRIWTFGHIPSSFPCPEAWKDPVADYVWWLA